MLGYEARRRLFCRAFRNPDCRLPSPRAILVKHRVEVAMSHVDDTAVQAGRATASAVVRPSVGRCGAGLLREASAGAHGERSDTRDGWRGPRLGDRARAAMRVKHLSVRTEEAYLGWMRRYDEFHGRKDPVGQEFPWFDDLVRAGGPSDSPSSSPATRSERCSRAWTASPG
jgi:hypothetical protein